MYRVQCFFNMSDFRIFICMSECVWALAENICPDAIVSQIVFEKCISNRLIKLGFCFIEIVFQMMCNLMFNDTTLFSSNGPLIPKTFSCMGEILKISRLFSQVTIYENRFYFSHQHVRLFTAEFVCNSQVAVIHLMIVPPSSMKPKPGIPENKFENSFII